MAQADIDANLGVVDKRKISNQNSDTTNLTAVGTNYDDISSMKSVLASNGYSTTQLNTMLKNDMVYAVRLIVDPTGIV